MLRDVQNIVLQYTSPSQLLHSINSDVYFEYDAFKYEMNVDTIKFIMTKFRNMKLKGVNIINITNDDLEIPYENLKHVRLRYKHSSLLSLNACNITHKFVNATNIIIEYAHVTLFELKELQSFVFNNCYLFSSSIINLKRLELHTEWYNNEQFVYDCLYISKLLHWCPNLITLIIDNVIIKHVPIISEKLKIFKCPRFGICNSMNQNIFQCPNLKILDIKINEASQGKIGTNFSDYGNLKNLECLRISSDKLSDISILRDYKKLKYVDVSKCPKINNDILYNHTYHSYSTFSTRH